MSALNEKIIGVRLLVGFLGEAEQLNWWSSCFLSSSSDQILGHVFKKTTLLAKYNGVCEAARRIHDEKIGMGDIAHLFRLPELLEIQLKQTLKDTADQKILIDPIVSVEAATEALATFSKTNGEAVDGPIKIDQEAPITASDWLLIAVGHYVSAFAAKTKCYPYFSYHS